MPNEAGADERARNEDVQAVGRNSMSEITCSIELQVDLTVSLTLTDAQILSSTTTAKNSILLFYPKPEPPSKTKSVNKRITMDRILIKCKRDRPFVTSNSIEVKEKIARKVSQVNNSAVITDLNKTLWTEASKKTRIRPVFRPVSLTGSSGIVNR